MSCGSTGGPGDECTKVKEEKGKGMQRGKRDAKGEVPLRRSFANSFMLVELHKLKSSGNQHPVLSILDIPGRIIVASRQIRLPDRRTSSTPD